MLASVVALCGVAIIVGNARVGSEILGIALAFFMALAIAAMTVMVRRHKETSMVAAAAISNILGSVVSIPFAHGMISVTGFDLFILAMFGFFQVAIGLTLFFLGSRLLPSSQAALISTLETPLMPFWVWLAFAEVPGSRVLIGGALVMGAVVADIIGDSRKQKRIRLSSRGGPRGKRQINVSGGVGSWTSVVRPWGEASGRPRGRTAHEDCRTNRRPSRIALVAAEAPAHFWSRKRALPGRGTELAQKRRELPLA